jgi:hypothetical protein
MQSRIARGLLPAPATTRGPHEQVFVRGVVTWRWSRSRERGICPRRHLRVLPIRTRPSLFGGD